MFEIFKTFSNSELNFFEAYLKTKYFNGSDMLLKLYKNLLLFPDFDKDIVIENVMKDENVLGRAYPEQAVLDYYYKLINKAKEFLSFKRYLNDEYGINKLLLEELGERNLEKNFMKQFREIFNRTLEEKESTQRYSKLYYLYEKMFNFTERNNHILKHADSDERLNLIKKCSRYKYVYLFMEQVSLYATYMINLYSYGDELSPANVFETDIINSLYLNISNEERSPLLNLYFKLFLLFKHIDDINYYHQYRDYFTSTINSIHPDENKHHFHFLVNYCTIKKLIASNKFFESELLELYKLYLKNKFFTYEGEKYIQTRTILNIIKLSKLNGDLKWIKDFIYSNDDLLNPGDKKNIKCFLNAYDKFLNNDFKSALNEINKINLDHFSYKYDIQTLKIRLLYDLGGDNMESALSNIESYKQILKSDKFLLKETKEKTLKFLKYTKNLITTNNNKNNLEVIYGNLKEEEHINFKKWLLKEYEQKLLL